MQPTHGVKEKWKIMVFILVKGVSEQLCFTIIRAKRLLLIKKQQANITPELKAYADRMVRCEVRLYSQQLRDDQLQYGHCWNDELIKQLVQDNHNRLNLPEPISEIELPSKFIRYLATHKQGASHTAYTVSTIARYKRDLARDYGLIV